mmetsp:Transcript_11558/g.49282  ORF Transcript_11558/g.49282 Transcript_11558/m.49282 type:complete len:231 (-) Transcript_11558:17-709(-)
MVVNPSRDAKDETRDDGKLFSPVVSCFASQKNDAGTSFDAGTPKRSRISLVSTGEHTSVRSLLCTAASSRATLGSPAAGTAASEARRTDSDSSAPYFFLRAFHRVVPGVPQRVQILHVQYARGVWPRGSYPERERLLGGEPVEDHRVRLGLIERVLEVGAAVGRHAMRGDPTPLQGFGVLVRARARQVMHPPAPFLERLEQRARAHARRGAARLGPQEADEQHGPRRRGR